MYRKVIGVLTALLLILTMLTACGRSAATADVASQEAAPSVAKSTSTRFGGEVGAVKQNPGDNGSADTEAAAPASAGEADSLAGGSASTVSVSNAVLAERKMIWTASLNLEVENFDKARNTIESILTGIGFVSNTDINSSNVYVDGKLKTVKSGTLVLRVDKEKFDSVINKLYGVGDVSNETKNGEDVTDQFVDIESRLRLLKIEQEKLETFLAKATDLDSIFKIETRITDIRYEIEGLTGNLNKLSSLVELATINITMNEKYPGSEKKPVTYGEELLNSLKGSLKSVVRFLGDFLIFIVAALPVLVVMGLFVLLGIFIYRRIPKKSKGTFAGQMPQSPSKPAVPDLRYNTQSHEEQNGEKDNNGR